jgi:restriction system protein
MAILGDDDVGIFFSTSGFTGDADEEARKQQTRQVTCVNLQRLYDLWIEHLNKLDSDARDLLPLKAIYFLAPNQ